MIQVGLPRPLEYRSLATLQIVASWSWEMSVCEESVRLFSSFLARIIHERFCCIRGFAAATRLDAAGAASRQAGSPLGRSTDC